MNNNEKNLKKMFLDQLKNDEEDDEVIEVELIEEKNEIQESKSISPVLQEVDKTELISSLKGTKKKANEVLEHLIDLLYNEHPDSQKITETSKIISNLIMIDKTLYDIALKTKDETTKDIMVKNSAGYIKELIKNSEINKNKE